MGKNNQGCGQKPEINQLQKWLLIVISYHDYTAF